MKNELPHPGYDSYSTDSDFVLVFLDRAVTSTNVDLVTLNSQISIPAWGKM